jgi:hypothetical protein
MSDAPHEQLDDERDELCLDLGRLEREAELIEPPAEWEAVARGDMSVEQALGSGSLDADPALAAAYFRPFDAGERDSLVDGLLAAVAAPAAVPAPAVAPAPEPDNVIPLAAAKPKPHDPASSKFWWIPGGMLAAAAAAILAWWVWPPNAAVQRIDGPRVAALDPLPSYVLETDGGLKELRGDTGSEDAVRHRYAHDTPFEWVLRPKTDVSEPVGVRAFAFVEGGRAGLPVDLQRLATVAASGAVRITGKIADLNLEPGRYTIALVVGRPDALPTDASAVLEPADGASDATAAWSARRIEILIED